MSIRQNSQEDVKKSVVPEHLPKRLTIACWLWNWATDRQPGEGFSEIEKALDELVDRKFNTIRIDGLWSWAFDLKGNPRGEVEVGNMIEPGYCKYSFNNRGGFRVNVLDELIRLLHLAKERDIYVALTSWEFQPGHSIGFLADPALRSEILNMPAKERFTYLARQADRLLQEIKRHGLEDRIAYLEIHNEVNYSAGRDFPGGMPAIKEAVEKCLTYLQERHADILFTDDYQVDVPEDYIFDYNNAIKFTEKFAANVQVLDHHLYNPTLQYALFRKAGIREGGAMEQVEKENEFFKWLIRPGSPSWKEFSQHFTCDWFKNWQPLVYLFENMDVDKYDYWMFRHYPQHEERMRTFWKNYIQLLSHFACQRGVPIVCDEGYIFLPPIHSNFETSAIGKSSFDFIVDNMLEAGYWGIMISTYTQPGQPLWENEAEWLKETNKRILEAE